MATISVLVDTDIFIDYFNSGRFSAIFDSSRFTVYYSIVTKKELLSKPGAISPSRPEPAETGSVPVDAERQAILAELGRCRIIKLTETITVKYTELRGRYPSLAKEDALIAASALIRNMPLITRNKRHFQVVKGLTILGS